MEYISPTITSLTTSPSAIKSTLCLESYRKVKFTFEPHQSTMPREGTGPHYQILTRLNASPRATGQPVPRAAAVAAEPNRSSLRAGNGVANSPQSESWDADSRRPPSEDWWQRDQHFERHGSELLTAAALDQPPDFPNRSQLFPVASVREDDAGDPGQLLLR